MPWFQVTFMVLATIEEQPTISEALKAQWRRRLRASRATPRAEQFVVWPARATGERGSARAGGEPSESHGEWPPEPGFARREAHCGEETVAVRLHPPAPETIELRARPKGMR